MSDENGGRGPWESREWSEPEEPAGPPQERPSRPPALAGWIGAACLIGSGVYPWLRQEEVSVVGMVLSAAMVTAGVALAFVLVRRWFVPPEHDGRQ